MVLIWCSTDLVDHGAIGWEAISRETLEIKVQFVVLCKAKISLLREGLESDRGDNRTLSGNVVIHNLNCITQGDTGANRIAYTSNVTLQY